MTTKAAGVTMASHLSVNNAAVPHAHIPTAMWTTLRVNSMSSLSARRSPSAARAYGASPWPHPVPQIDLQQHTIEHLRHEQPGDRQQDQLRQEQQREDAIGEQSRRSFAALAVNMRVGRNEGGIEGALGEDGAKAVGQAQRHEERISDRAGAEDHHVRTEQVGRTAQLEFQVYNDASELVPALGSPDGKTLCLPQAAGATPPPAFSAMVSMPLNCNCPS